MHLFFLSRSIATACSTTSETVCVGISSALVSGRATYVHVFSQAKSFKILLAIFLQLLTHYHHQTCPASPQAILFSFFLLFYGVPTKRFLKLPHWTCSWSYMNINPVFSLDYIWPTVFNIVWIGRCNIIISCSSAWISKLNINMQALSKFLAWSL